MRYHRYGREELAVAFHEQKLFARRRLRRFIRRDAIDKSIIDGLIADMARIGYRD